MANAAWYGLIMGMSLLLFIYTLFRVRNRKTFALYVFMAGITYLLEYVVLIALNGYEFKPHILDKSYYDNVLGAVVSDLFVVPISAAFIGSFQLGFVWILLIAGLVTLIEVLFLHLGIYKHHWWHVGYTMIGLVICFIIAKKWHRLLNGKLSMIVRISTLYCAAQISRVTLSFIQFYFLHLYTFHIGLVQNQDRDNLLFSPLYFNTTSLLFSFLAVYRMNWKWVSSVMVFMIAFDHALHLFGFLQIHNGWAYLCLPSVNLILIFTVYGFDRAFLKPNDLHGKKSRV